ncbi:hypothetical protein EJ05DRAFT_259666 [Pseudovirgaria hyperparasitica]|uniref:Glycosyltransferase family 25 protein n=1 Tax=Pseudovirgaria hyperparasitica TaxID=470096 RepID=A0A6A6WJ65_9PEZI|nr:uncharacterized protein EJ05DRAFT_259666 [Pseudovirgaria hyperparasitica]KAF2761321.1 hypothetical protein EJ05DRAFT_259666 [Pseudovirgaria hyperparasitica]
MMLPASRILRSKALLGTGVVIWLLFLFHYWRSGETGILGHWRGSSGADNSTLGFQSIIAIAPKDVPDRLKWRQQGLLAAASRSRLDITIPEISVATEDQIEALIREQNGESGRAFALSWLGHLNAIREASKQGTTLIIEDDADWDVNIRPNMPLIASGMRNLTRYGRNDTTSPTFLPYGDSWDLLWLGHCGENIDWHWPMVRFEDPLVPPYINSWEKSIAPDPGHIRTIHKSVGPICSFAYALTGDAATKILAEKDQGTESFDIWLHIMCKGERLRCLSVNPELFHHHEAAGHRDSLINGESDEEVVEKAVTQNIWHSARCNTDQREEPLIECMGEDERGKGDW